MKRILIVPALILALALVPATATSAANSTPVATPSSARYLQKLGASDAKWAARGQLLKYYGNKWKHAYHKRLWIYVRLSRTRVRVAYEFNDRREAGYITVWRSGRGYLSSYISPL